MHYSDQEGGTNFILLTRCRKGRIIQGSEPQAPFGRDNVAGWGEGCGIESNLNIYILAKQVIPLGSRPKEAGKTCFHTESDDASAVNASLQRLLTRTAGESVSGSHADHLRGSLNTSVRAISGATAVTAASSSPLSGALTLGWNMSHDFLSYSWAI